MMSSSHPLSKSDSRNLTITIMKQFVVGVMMMTVSVGAFAQGDAVTRFFSKYQNDETFSQVTISSKMFSMLTDMQVDDPEDQEVISAISKLKGLRILAKEETRDGRLLYKEALSMIPVKEYEELMSVRDEDKDMKFFIKETSPGKISELVMVAGGNDDFMVLSLFGEIDLKQIGKIGSKMDIDGLDDLNKLDDKSKKKTSGDHE
jgi:CRISPR/Cas system Type II protein with McrA/HNH and RuvC-like nuclease domain